VVRGREAGPAGARDSTGQVWARRGGRGNGRPATRRASQRSESALRSLVCSARASEETGRFLDAMRAWRALRGDEQVLRCRVLHLDHEGHLAKAARLLVTKHRYRAAAERWQRAGDLEAVARCEALEHERRDRFEEAAARWASLGELKHEARCRAIVHFRRGEYEAAARAYEAAGQATMVVVSRLMASKLRGDYDGARRLLEEANLKGLPPTSLGPRARFMAEARAPRGEAPASADAVTSW